MKLAHTAGSVSSSTVVLPLSRCYRRHLAELAVFVHD
jgi:hypothetical protein